MYESEVNAVLESVQTLPRDVVARFAELRSSVVARTTLPWGEHCTECAAPGCYMTCALYAPRPDNACRLFVDGMVRIDAPASVNAYLLRVRFKRWGKLWTVGTLAMYALAEADRREQRNIALGGFARALPLPRPLKARVLGKVGHLRRRASERATGSPQTPDSFVLESYNPGAGAIDLRVTFQSRAHAPEAGFTQTVRAVSGFTRHQIPVRDIARQIDLHRPFQVEIVPDDAEDAVLYFGLVDFVALRPTLVAPGPPNGTPKPWKCIVWDLDNTLWDGTLVEDGPERIRIRPEVVEVIEATDRRGILHSIASKNNHADAMMILQQHGLADYFLHPQINWDPKSRSVARIAELLGIGVDTLAFVDDQPFEREEVATTLPTVTVIDAREAPGLPARPECDVPVTEEASQRRAMYQQDAHRQRTLSSYDGDYLAFLRDCRIELRITALTASDLERVYELAQRTNQMNFSGVRYTRDDLAHLQQSDHHATFVMRCTDRFGSYGLIGFAVVDTAEPRLLDLMFSCRIQAKRVEHAFLAHVIAACGRPGRRDVFANFRRTPRNAVHGKVFDDIGFEPAGEADGVLSLVFAKHKPIPREDVIALIDERGWAR